MTLVRNLSHRRGTRWAAALAAVGTAIAAVAVTLPGSAQAAVENGLICDTASHER